MKILVATAVLAMLSSTSAFSQKQVIGPSKPPATQAAPNEEGCLRLKKRIHSALKTIASERIGGVTDNSAARETNRLLREVSSMLMIDTAVNQMSSLNCPVLADTLDPDRYFIPAMECHSAKITATQRHNLGIKPSPEEKTKLEQICNQANWIDLREPLPAS